MSKLKKAMLRAKELRELNSGGEGEEAPFSDQNSVDGNERSREKQTSPSYSMTKTVQTPMNRLKKNRIFSFLHESRVSRQMKILRTQILNKLSELNGNSVLVTSSKPKEGKTFTSVNLAVSLAQEVNCTTLLVDTDLRQPSIDKVFGFDNAKGITDYLLRNAEIPDLLINPGIPKLTILPAGSPLPNSTELLGAPRMQSLVKEMKSRYSDRILVFDSSSLLASADPLVFSRYIDGVLLIVESENTTDEDLNRALELLEDRPLLGVVWNKSKEPAATS